MWRESYLRRAAALEAGLGAAYGPAAVASWTSDLVSREDLVQRLATTPVRLAVYLGHGRASGWSGYRGLRWRHLEPYPPTQPMGALVSLSCANLAFGQKLLEEGRVAAFLGTPAALEVKPFYVLIDLLRQVFETGPPATIGALVAALSELVDARQDACLTKNWSAFQLIGNPAQTI